MRVLRAVNRRGWNTRTAAGYLFVEQRRWFPASQLPDGFHRPHVRLASEEAHATLAKRAETRALFEPEKQAAGDRSWLRTAFVVLAAFTVTLMALACLAAMGTWYR